MIILTEAVYRDIPIYQQVKGIEKANEMMRENKAVLCVFIDTYDAYRSRLDVEYGLSFRLYTKPFPLDEQYLLETIELQQYRL